MHKMAWGSKESISGSVFRECVLADDSVYICLTVWCESLISFFEEKLCYCFTDFSVRSYFGVKFTASWKISGEQIKENIEVK